MAKRQFMSKGRSGRVFREKTRDSVLGKGQIPTKHMKSVYVAIEQERDRLSKAETILECMFLAMDEEEAMESHKPYYPHLVLMAMQLIRESLHQLDSATLAQRRRCRPDSPRI